METVIEGIGDGALAGAAKASEPDDAAAVTVQGLAAVARNLVFVPDHIGIVRHYRGESCC